MHGRRRCERWEIGASGVMSGSTSGLGLKPVASSHPLTREFAARVLAAIPNDGHDHHC